MKPLRSLFVGVLLTSALTASAFGLSEAGTVNASGLNMRAEANTSSAVYTVASRGSSVVILSQEDNWYQVYYNGLTGYMHSDYIEVSDSLDAQLGTGVISASDVNMRDEPSLGGTVLGTYANGTEMEIVGLDDGWYKVSYEGQLGYVRSNLMVLTDPNSSSGEGSVENENVSENQASDSSQGQAIVDTAMQYLGVPYVYGGSSPSGFDCSGLVYYVYQQNGYSINRVAADQAQNGSPVAREDLQAGDIVYFCNGSGGSVGHSGIYIGDGQFIHASSGGGKVMISDLSSNYYSTYYGGARRIV